MKKFESWILSDGLDLKSESDVKLYMEYNALDVIVLDIWKWVKQSFNQYPVKISKDSIIYDGPYRSKIKIDIIDMKVIVYRINPKGTKVLFVSKFSWSSLRKSFDFDF